MHRFALTAPKRRQGNKSDRCFLDVSIDDKPVGRIVIKLDTGKTPETAENFRLLCTGEFGASARTRTMLQYTGSHFHRVLKGYLIQGGDITRNDGSGGEAAIKAKASSRASPGFFDDENLKTTHDRPGRVSMANKGPDSNNSQFFITLAPCRHLDGKNVCFGDVEKGMDIVLAVSRLDTVCTGTAVDATKPAKPVVITDCGEYMSEDEEQPELRADKAVEQQLAEAERVVDSVADAVSAALAKKRKVAENGRNAVAKKKKKKSGMMSLQDESSDSE
ncbi:Peptidyl-prolyl cis-trans isomerase CYP40 [Diplonema papillatum]|nr:Peptidyl-prolyl cis-trans isomerase CYP40 [Diplonema papillatum]